MPVLLPLSLLLLLDPKNGVVVVEDDAAAARTPFLRTRAHAARAVSERVHCTREQGRAQRTTTTTMRIFIKLFFFLKCNALKSEIIIIMIQCK